MSFTHVRRYAQQDAVQVIDGGASWDIPRPADIVQDPTRLWLHVEGSGEETKLMNYNWDTDEWAEWVEPEPEEPEE